MALEAAVVRFTSPVSSGTVDVTSSGFGTPTAALIFESYADGNMRLYDDHGGFQVGMWASTGGTGTEACQGFYTSNNAASGQPYFFDNSGSLIKVGYNGDTCGTVDSVITDGLRLDFTNYYDQDFICVLFKGTVAVSLTSSTVGASSTKDFSLGHEPHVVFMACVDVDAANVEHISFGVGHYDGTTFNQIHVSHAEKQSADPTQNWLGMFSNSIGSHQPGYGREFTASRPSADTLRLTMEGASGAEDIIFLAFELDDPANEFAVGMPQCTLTAANTESYTIATGFEPACLGIFGGMLSDTLNGYLTSYKAAGFGVGVADGTGNQHAVGFRSQDGVATTATGSYQDNINILAVMKHNSTSVVAREAALASFDSNGFTLDWGAVNANAQYFGYWAIKAAGATTHEASISLGQSRSITPQGTAVVGASASFGHSRGIAPTAAVDYACALALAIEQASVPVASATLQAGLSLGLARSFVSVGQAVLDAALALNTQLSESASGTGVYQAMATFAKTQQVTQGGDANLHAALQLANTSTVLLLANSNLAANVTFNRDAQLAYSGDIEGGTQVIEAAIGFALQQATTVDIAVTFTGDLVVSRSHSLPVDPQADLSASAGYGHVLALQAIAGGVLEAGLALAAIRSITTDGNVLQIVVQTPDGRVITIRAEDRTIRVAADDRLITVPADDRDIKIH